MNINTNISALSAQSNVASAQKDMAVNMERLSTGKRINGASDDAAGLQISQRFDSQLSGLKMAERNANDGISVAETAESALGNVSDMLQRMRELSVQSSNGALNDSDRASLDAEVDQLLEEINGVGDRTQFNNNKLLDGSYQDKSFQIGANQSDTMAFSLGSVKTDDLGSSNAASLSAMGVGEAMAAGDLEINGVAIGPSLADSDTASNVNQNQSAISKVAAINAKSDETGVTATVEANMVYGAEMTAASLTGSMRINGVTITVSTVADDAEASRAAVVSAINQNSGRTGVVAINTNSDKNGVQLVAEDGRNIKVSLSTVTSASTGLVQGTKIASYTLTSDSDINISRGATNTAAALDNTGLREGTYSSQQASVSSVADTDQSWARGDLIVNGSLIRETRAVDDSLSFSGEAQSGISKAAAINAHTSETGVTATADVNRVDSGGTSNTDASAAGTMVINGVTTSSFSLASGTAEERREEMVNAINEVSARTGVTAVDTGSTTGVQLVAEDGRNITVSLGTDHTSAQTGIVTGTYTGSFTLHSASAIEIGTEDQSNFDANADFTHTGTYGSGKSGQALSTIDISSSDGALKAVTAIDNALEQVNEMRSDLGAKQNRLDYTISNLQDTHTNMSASQSRMTDTDFATESTELAKNKILQQAGMAMLAQANQSGQQVLSLLR